MRAAGAGFRGTALFSRRTSARGCGEPRAAVGRPLAGPGPPTLRCGVVRRASIATKGLFRARVLLDAGCLTSLGLAKPLMIAVFLRSAEPLWPGLWALRGLGRVEGLLVCLRTLGANRRNASRLTRLLLSPRVLLDTPARIWEAVETSKIVGPGGPQKQVRRRTLRAIAHFERHLSSCVVVARRRHR